MQFKGKIRVVSEHDGIEKVLVDVENTITELFEEVVAAGSIDMMYGMNSAIEGGQTFLGIQNPEISSDVYYTTPNYFITVYFLNLGSAELQALTKKSHTLPIYAGDYTLDESKIVGFATSTYTATKPKQGYLDPLKGENLIKHRRHGLRFKWDANVLSGSYNCIAVGMRTDVDRFSGISMYRGVETANPILGEAVARGYWLRPGVKNSDGSNYKIREATRNNLDDYVYPIILVNDINHLSNKSINLHIDFFDNNVYKEYQLGYVFKHGSETVGRIIGTYNINVNDIIIADNTYLEELTLTLNTAFDSLSSMESLIGGSVDMVNEIKNSLLDEVTNQVSADKLKEYITSIQESQNNNSGSGGNSGNGQGNGQGHGGR